MEIQGADGFRIGAYRKAAAQIRETPTSVAKLALEGRAKELQGIGKTIEEKIVEVVDDGEIHALTKRKAEVPVEVATLHPPAGPRAEDRAPDLAGARDHDRRRPARRGRGRAAACARRARAEGRGEDPGRARASPRRRRDPSARLLGNTLPKLRAAAAALAEHPAAVEVSIAGSARRFRETVRDLDIIATATDPAALIDAFCSLPWVVEVAAKGPTKATVVSQDGAALRPARRSAGVVRQPAPALHRLEGAQRRAARGGGAEGALGLRVRDHRGRDRHGPLRSRPRRRSTRSSATRWIPPELRENLGELDAARRNELPELVELADIRGDLHTHTTWSDGKNSLEEMVARAIEKGYDYYAICDHSHRLRDGLLAAAGTRRSTR